MPTPLEALQEAEQHWQHCLDLLQQADLALEQVHTFAEHYQRDHPNPPALMQAIRTVQGELASVTNRHNELVAQIREAQADAQQRQDAENQ